jgi:integrase
MPGRRQHAEGSLYQRKSDGRWIAVVHMGWKDGKRQRRVFTGTTAETAVGRRNKFLEARRDGFTMPKGRQPYVSEWLLHWLHNIAKRKVAQTTWEKSYRQKVTDLICPYFERVPLPELAEEDIEYWHAQLEETISARTGQPLSASTIGQAHRIFSSALKAAVVRGRLPRNPCSNVTPPAVDEVELVPPPADEVTAILDRCKTWPNGARWVLAITTGLRQGEALDLEWRYVQLERPRSLRVEWSAAWVGGERIRKRPKSKASRRSVPLAAVTAGALAEHRKAQIRSITADYVFTDAKGAPVHPRADWQDWQDLLTDVGLQRYRVHDLRHGYATMLLEAGVDPRVVQAMLGWSTLAMLARYQHVRPVMHEAVADAVDAALGMEATPVAEKPKIRGSRRRNA